MTVTSIITRQPVADTATEHPLVAAIIELADTWGTDLTAKAAHTIATGLVGPELVHRVEEIAGLLDSAARHEVGTFDPDFPTDRAANLEANRLRGEACLAAQLTASLALVNRYPGMWS